MGRVAKPKIAFVPVVFSKGKPEMTYTGDLLKSWKANKKVIWVVSEGDDVDQYKKVTKAKSVIVAKGCPTLAEKRRWAIENLTSKNRPWLFWMEDNIKKITAVDKGWYDYTRINTTKREWYHSRELDWEQLSAILVGGISNANTIGAHYGGFACNDNHFFRKTHWRDMAFIWTKMAYFHRNSFWQVGVNEKDDYLNTAHQIATRGCTMCDNFVYPWPKRYEGRGGSRTLEERFEDKIVASKIIMQRYPGLFRFRSKAGCPAGAEIQMKVVSDSGLKKWWQSIGGERVIPADFDPKHIYPHMISSPSTTEHGA
jgi:hypothetical protein